MTTKEQWKEIIERATPETNAAEDWGVIMTVCDRFGTMQASEASSTAMLLLARLRHANPRVGLQAVHLLSASIMNCAVIRTAVCTRDFTAELKKLFVGKALSDQVRTKLGEAMEQWEKEYNGQAAMDLLLTAIRDLRLQGQLKFVASTALPRPTTTTSAASSSSTSNSAALAAARKKEEEELKLAIAASLRESQPPAAAPAPAPAPQRKTVARNAKVLFDFEAHEENELDLIAGDTIVVLDDSDENWWSGRNKTNATGFFPSSFVTYNLNTQVAAPVVAAAPAKVEINEESLDKLLELLSHATPGVDPRLAKDRDLIERLERDCQAMAPLIEEQLRAVSRQQEQLALLNRRYTAAHTLAAKLHETQLAKATAAAAAMQYQQPHDLMQVHSPQHPQYAMPPPQHQQHQHYQPQPQPQQPQYAPQYASQGYPMHPHAHPQQQQSQPQPQQPPQPQMHGVYATMPPQAYQPMVVPGQPQQPMQQQPQPQQQPPQQQQQPPQQAWQYGQ
eukprot:m.211291 g.211291  ORF g.211291 m.211291 type:complete len:505 (-) comp18111_c0_seq1:1320-2834(-)